MRFAGAHYRVRDGVSPIDREAAAHPHIAFFARNNPAHVEGEELVCLAEIRARDLMWALSGADDEAAAPVDAPGPEADWREGMTPRNCGPFPSPSGRGTG